MRKFYPILISAFQLFLLNSCVIYQIQPSMELVATSRNQNVCGHLKDSVILYAVFVDIDALHPFTRFDIESTMDSVEKACNWVNSQAQTSKVQLSLHSQIHQGKNKWSFHERRAFTKLRLSRISNKSSNKRGGILPWSNAISTYVDRGLKRQNTNKLGTRIKIQSTEQLVARLRDLYSTDNIALMFFINGYYEILPSISLNTSSTGPGVEFSVITEKNPAVIAHEFLHLFGAIDLYPTPNHPQFNYKEIQEIYPNEIMRITHKPIENLEISPITRYYLGWNSNLDKANTRLLYHLANVLPY